MLEKIKLAINFLLQHQTLGGSICDPNIEIFDVWETINAIEAVSTWSKLMNDYSTSSVINRAIIFLQSAENPDGSILQKHYNPRNSYCIETTSQYVSVLIDTENNQSVRDKLNFIRDKQLPFGNWRVGSPQVPEELQEFPSATAFALKALFKGGYKVNYEYGALAFLKNTQTEDGHWGVTWAAYGTPYYMMVPILEILKSTESTAIRSKAKSYLFESQIEGRYWFYRLDDFENISPELQTALAIQSCLHCGVHPTSDRILKSFTWLLDQQNFDGSWNGGYFPRLANKPKKSEHIYATSQVLIAISKYAADLYFS